MSSALPDRLRLSGGTELAFVADGDRAKPALVLLHGYASSLRTFREVIPALSRVAYVIAPDLPGYGLSDPLPTSSFAAFSDAILDLLRHLDVTQQRFINLHDWGAPVGLNIAMPSEQVAGLIIQNANAHRTGFAPQWKDTFAYWSNATEENKAKATSFLTFEDTRGQYTRDVPADVVAEIKGEPWVEDWRVLNLPGRMEMQRILLADYGKYVANFDAIDAYLKQR